MKPGKADYPGFRARWAVPSCTSERNLSIPSASSYSSRVCDGGDTSRVVSNCLGKILGDSDAGRTKKNVSRSSGEPESEAQPAK